VTEVILEAAQNVTEQLTPINAVDSY